MDRVKNYIIERGLYKKGRLFDLKLQQLFFRNSFDRKLRDYSPLIVYQMGKVASATIYHSLINSYPGIVLHTHTFGSDDWNWQVSEVYKHSMIEKKPLKVISLTREPISRNISAFFQNYRKYTGESFSKSNYSIEELIQLFLDKFDHFEPLIWFDKHIKSIFDIDVYNSNFPDCGFATYSKNNIQLLVIRSEINDTQKKNAICEFLELPNFEIIPKNVGTNRVYATTYRSFVNTIKLSDDYIDEMLNSRYATYFYSQEFIEQSKTKWKRY